VSQLSTEKECATDGLDSLAQAARRSTQAFRDSQQHTSHATSNGPLIKIERFSSRLRMRDATDLVQDVRQFARRQPALFMGAALAAALFRSAF
jgi:hypothetical protein